VTDLSNLIAELACGDDVRAERARTALASHGLEALPVLLRLAQSETRPRWWRCAPDRRYHRR
jgi:hypothetical protein